MDLTTSRDLAGAWLGDVTVLTERLMSAIFTDNPEWTDYRPVTRQELRDGCHRYLSRVLGLLAGEQPVTELHDVDDVAEEIGRQRAEQGVPLEAMLRTFRLGGRIVWEALLESAATVRADPAVVGAAATEMWTVVDHLSSALSSAYRGAQLEQMRRDERWRHALIEELLADRAREEAFARRAGDQLELPVSGVYLVLVVDISPDGAPALRGSRTVLGALHVRSVWHTRADSQVGLVSLEGRPPRSVLDRLRPLVRGRVAAAVAQNGLPDIGVAHRLAVTTLSTIARGTVALVTVDDRYPESLLVRSPELAHRLVAARLGPVLELPAKERDMLLTTLTAWLEADRSAGLAAARLYCHRNTVLNRLQRLSTLLDRDLTGRQAFVELSLALSALGLEF